MPLLNRDKKVLIVGLGLIGGSFAEGLTRIGYEVGAIDARQEAIDFALSKGIISHGCAEVTPEYVRDFDIIIFGLYPKVFVSWIERWQHCLKKGALITDVTGVKRVVVNSITPILRDDLDFVPAHPMAGREVYGVENSSAAILRGANFIITPTERSSAAGIETVRDLAVLLGFGHISVITPAEHDEMIGFLSQLTHCIAVTLMACKESKHLAEYTGDSFRDLTRIARINENMWAELFLENKDELLDQIDLFMGKCKEMRDALANDDAEKMKEMMRLSTERRSYFDKKQS